MKREAKYYIYRNLNRGKNFSVKFRGRVIAVLESIRGEGVSFQVSKAGRERVLATGKRNVHAFARCDSWKPGPKLIMTSAMTPVWYNPYKAEQFRAGDIDIHEAAFAYFYEGKCYV